MLIVIQSVYTIIALITRWYTPHQKYMQTQILQTPRLVSASVVFEDSLDEFFLIYCFR